MKLFAYKNNTSSTVELQFNGYTERIEGFSIGHYHIQDAWKGSFAESQANEFVKRNNGRILLADSKDVSLDKIHSLELEKFNQAENQVNKNEQKKGAKNA